MLTIQNIYKSFAEKLVLKDVSFSLETGSILVLLGPSGCGKTTLLRIIAGLETADSGTVTFQGQEMAGVPLHQRGFGMVFQDYALFPHKNVYHNVAFGLRMQRWQKDAIQERVAQVLALVGLAGYETRAVHELSGGEMQRVALARALAPAPRLLLLDEPLGALDRTLRERLMLDLRAILKEAGGVLGRPEGMTAVYVTHDQSEAFAIADKVAVMQQGQIEQMATPLQLYLQPRTPFVARFLGMENVVAGVITAVSPLHVETPLGEFMLPTSGQYQPGQRVSLLIRPEAAVLDSGEVNQVNGRVLSASFRGRYQTLTMQTEGGMLRFEIESNMPLPEPGERITLSLRMSQLLLLESG
ncbi:MAG: ABC transporter ATP-binding protein [Candidatus Thermofonsia bacterium]|nr:MAG: ABC transporter ATP-binding protein [Candidatus Thermofonsia bacterium]